MRVRFPSMFMVEDKNESDIIWRRKKQTKQTRLNKNLFFNHRCMIFWNGFPTLILPPGVTGKFAAMLCMPGKDGDFSTSYRWVSGRRTIEDMINTF